MIEIQDTIYFKKPWLKNYTKNQSSEVINCDVTLLELFKLALNSNAENDCINYFDNNLTYKDIDYYSDAFSFFLKQNGFKKGDRLAIFLQNMPHIIIAMLAVFKLGGALVPINPMNQEREVNLIINDCKPFALLCLDNLYNEIIAKDSQILAQNILVIATNSHSFQSLDDIRIMPPKLVQNDEIFNFENIIEQNSGKKIQNEIINKDDIALLVYTSGTTGVPKAAIIKHKNAASNAITIANWYNFESKIGPILGIAPLFHITGIVGHIALAWVLKTSLVLTYRFEPSLIIETIEKTKPSFTVGAITVFNALMHHKDFNAKTFDSFHAIVSGGAPIPPSLIEEFNSKTGRYIHNGYGLTESCAGVICVPFEKNAPVDANSGAISIGVPADNVIAWIADDEGKPLGVNEIGEVILIGPSIVDGYWEKPEESQNCMRQNGFRTGDVGFMDENGWFYLVDRKKDMINASGFKVYPREVEDVIYNFEGIKEVAVVGIKDDYRGETVHAFISLKANFKLDEMKLREFCKHNLAAYKCPKEFKILADLPKTATGKILKKNLRENSEVA